MSLVALYIAVSYVLQFPPISAHNQTPPNALTKHAISLLNVMQIMRKLIPTCETAPFFLYKLIKLFCIRGLFTMVKTIFAKELSNSK